ncbi:hypothetical protein EDC40_10360 [Aminobacter aminovorans]|uniref:Uncharacterized protein n=1 Tax=Aminobacter aminovorans TaxID=83263 RepID=A0A380WNV3_AMIAI|nr:hypothetical protein EDC40_10360 [Aminobacter aminovorans]SUU89992.1 Uncharacterised protein [Aminobacter aminovorans]
MANVKGGKDHSDGIETLAGQVLADKTAKAREKRLAAAVLAHADGKPAAAAKAKPAAKPRAAPVANKPAPKPRAAPAKAAPKAKAPVKKR